MKTLQFLKWTEICWTSESEMAIDRIDSIAKIYIYIHTSIYIFSKGCVKFCSCCWNRCCCYFVIIYIFYNMNNNNSIIQKTYKGEADIEDTAAAVSATCILIFFRS